MLAIIDSSHCSYLLPPRHLFCWYCSVPPALSSTVQLENTRLQDEFRYLRLLVTISQPSLLCMLETPCGGELPLTFGPSPHLCTPCA